MMMGVGAFFVRTMAFPVSVPEEARRGFGQRRLASLFRWVEDGDARRGSRDSAGVVVGVRAFFVGALAFPVERPEETSEASAGWQAGGFGGFVVVAGGGGYVGVWIVMPAGVRFGRGDGGLVA